MNSLTRRLAALEASHKQPGDTRQPTLAHWRMFNAGDTAGLPSWAVEALQQRRAQAGQVIAQDLENFSDIDGSL